MREYFRLKNRNKTWQPILSALLIFCLLFGSPFLAGAAENAALAEVKELINEYYVDPVSEQVLRASSIKQLLERLDDPNTQ
ncbi:MAG: hypothetical protein GX351_02625, partial [Peptococcaceae bacterium]|nr:hypothetical protein [Peptococcaceae bacterium]